MSKQVDRYAIFGNPVKHSMSPWIHRRFANACGQDMRYDAVQVAAGEFAAAARKFFDDGGCGLNVTVPFKRDAFDFAERHSERAKVAGAVNTLHRETNGAAGDAVFGDNTDGAGLLRDLKSNLGWPIAGRRVLILGAGGAARGALMPLLREKPAELMIVNRTAGRAEELALEISDDDDPTRSRYLAGSSDPEAGVVEITHSVPITGGGYGLLNDAEPFHLIINCTSASLSNDMPPLPGGLLDSKGYCYDMVYAAGSPPFMRWADEHGAIAAADGLGMLVEQAAEAFQLWRGLRPATQPVIADLRKTLRKTLRESPQAASP